MHLAEGGPGANPSGGDERLLQFTNAVASSQHSQREQVPSNIPSSQAASVPPPAQPHVSLSGSINPIGHSSSVGASKSLIHDASAMSVRYKVNN